MSNDYQLLQNVQHRLAMAENAIAYLTNEVQRLSNGRASHASQSHATQSLQTAIPLQPSSLGRRPYAQHAASHASQSQASHASHAQDQTPAPIPLSDILTAGEVVTFGIFTGRDETGAVKTSTVLATFDGTDLTVTDCNTVRSLVGLKTTKAGEILFKFMNGLKEAGLIERTFNALPWRLASVQRDGQKVTLAQLRAAKTE